MSHRKYVYFIAGCLLCLCISIAMLAFISISVNGTSEPVNVDSDVVEEEEGEWPFVAWVSVCLDLGKLRDKGLLVDDAVNADKRARCTSSNQFRNLIVTPSLDSGSTAKLEEVSTIQLLLVCRNSKLVEKLNEKCDGINARILLNCDEDKLSQVDIDLADVYRAIGQLVPEKKYSEEDISNLVIRSMNGTDIRLGDVAQIDIVFGGPYKERKEKAFIGASED